MSMTTMRRRESEKEKEDEEAMWKEIEVSESYLVCCMYEEAASLASSLLNRLLQDKQEEEEEEEMLLESVGMVLLQSLHLLGRPPSHFLHHFPSLKAIPPTLLHSLACLQIAQGSPAALSALQLLLQDFLNGWTFPPVEQDNEDYHYATLLCDSDNPRIVLPLHHYLLLVDLYAVSLLAAALNHVHLAISWVRNHPLLPHLYRHDLLARLHSMHSPQTTIPNSMPTADNNQQPYPPLRRELNECEGSPEAPFNEQSVLKLSQRMEPYFSCFRSVNLKFGNTKVVISSGKVLLGCLILFICYVFRKKQATLKRIVRRQVIAVKKAFVDLWQLAFSYQVNPLAAVQPLSAATRQGQ